MDMVMDEPTFLVRSFSHPSSESSREPIEGNLYRALGESISFGRCMSESLSWEKWSVFSHNRYLEEVEKFSKPGSVAQMKAYFEAHYKKKAAERAAASLECSNTVPIAASKQLSLDEVYNDSSVDSYLPKGEKSLLDEQQEKAVPDTEVIEPAGVNVCDSSDPDKELDAPNVEGEMVEIQNITDANNKSNQIEKSGIFSSIEDHCKIVVSTDEEMRDKEAASQEVIALTSNKVLKKSSPRLLTGSGAFKELLSPAKKEKSAQTRNENVEASVDRKRLRTKLLHASINCSSLAGESSRKFSPVIQKIQNSTICTALLNMSKDNSTTLQTRTGGAANGGLKRSLTEVKFEDGRTKPLNQSIDRGISAERKLNPLSVGQSSKSPSGNGSKQRSSIKFSPFRLRSEERVPKRKEFFEKLQEKRDTSKAEKKHQRTKPQGKGTLDVKRMLESAGLKTEANNQLPNNHRKPQPPKLGRKSTSSKVLERGPQPSRRPSGSTKSTNIEAEQKRTCRETRSISYHSFKNASENLSPNIQD